MTVRTYTFEGSPQQMGAAHGEALREDIHDVLGRWMDHLGATYRTPPKDLLHDFLGDTSLKETVARLAPEVDAELTAIAAAAGVDRDTLLAWNLLDELWWYAAQREDAGVPDAITCSGVGLRSGPSGVPVVAQNMDLEPFVTWDPIVLRLRPTGGIDAVVLVTPGGIGLCGCNAAGVAVTCNGLSQLRPSGSGLAVLFIVRRILAQPDLASVRTFLHDVPHASGQNYLVGGPDGVLSLECSAAGAIELGEGSGLVLHTNHPLASEDVVKRNAYRNSLDRLRYLEDALDPASDLAAIQAALSDRTVPVCKTGDLVRTYASMVMELSTPPAVWVSPGPPAPGTYEAVGF